jgi:hypothetical protein
MEKAKEIREDPETQLALGLLWQSIFPYQSHYPNYFILNLLGVLR